MSPSLAPNKPTPDLAAIERDPEAWLRAMYPGTFTADPADYHRRLLAWFGDIMPNTPHYTQVTVLARGFAKSSYTEAGLTYLGATGKRLYVLYCCNTKDQADDHVQSIGDLLESERIAECYPLLGERSVNKYGSSRGWRRNRLWTAAGFVVDALGLDVAVRGVKLGNIRPDLIVFDDVDSEDDSPTTIDRKIQAITTKILPARARWGTTLVVQNLIHSGGIVAQLVDGRADFLAEREVDGPHPALRNMTYERDGLTRSGLPKARITGGEPTWAYMDIPACQVAMDEMGLSAFLQECQHEVSLAGYARFDREALAVIRRDYEREPLPVSRVPEWLRGIDGLRLYSLPAPSIAYAAYTDPAEAKGRDYTATIIGEVESHRVVAVLEDNTREGAVHADVAITLLRWYNEAYYGWERAKDSEIANAVGRLGYTKVYRHEDAPLTNLQISAGRDPVLRLGYPMTHETKASLIGRMANAIETFRAPIPDKRLLDQAVAYVVTLDMKTEAQGGGHDDLVIAYAGFLLMCEQRPARQVRPEYAYDEAPRRAEPAGVKGTWA